MKRAGEFLSAILDEELMKKAKNYSVLFSSWEAITQEVDLASASAHSKITELDKYILMVEADHPGWIQLLQTKQSQLLKAARRRFPDLAITGISFRLCRDPSALSAALPSAKPAAEPASVPEAALSAAPVEEPAVQPVAADTGQDTGDDPYSKINDEELKNSLRQLEKSIKVRSKDICGKPSP